MAIALTGKYYAQISDKTYVKNLHSMQHAYLNTFGAPPITIGCIEVDNVARRSLLMFDGIRTLRFDRKASQQGNLAIFSLKVHCLFQLLHAEVDKQDMIMWSRIDIFVDTLRLRAPMHYDLHAYRNPRAANRLCDNLVVASVEAYRKVGFHQRDNAQEPEVRIESVCGSNISCTTFSEHIIFLVKPTTSSEYLHSKGLRVWTGDINRSRLPPRLPTPVEVRFSKFAACLSGEFRTFDMTYKGIETMLSQVNSTNFACFRNASAGQMETIRRRLSNVRDVRSIGYTWSQSDACEWKKYAKIFPMWEGISCAYESLRRYEIEHSLRFEYIIRLRTDGTYNANALLLASEAVPKGVYGLPYKRFLPEQLLCDHFYVTSRTLALATLRNDRPLRVCNRLQYLDCGRLPIPDTECLLKRRVEHWGGALHVLQSPRTIVVRRADNRPGPKCGSV
jgi:hypothetical protein